MRKLFITLCLSVFMFSSTLLADLIQDQVVKTSVDILRIFKQDYNGSNPNFKLPKRFYKENIKAVAVIPDFIRTGLIATFQKGTGIFSLKNPDGSWSDPLFIKLTGFGAGIQAGYSSTDVILLFDNLRSYSGIFSESETIDVGADIAVLGGGSSHHMTDTSELGANILAIGRSDGVIVGMSLDYSKLTIDDQQNIDYYDRIYTADDIVNGSPKDTEVTKRFKRALHFVFDNK